MILNDFCVGGACKKSKFNSLMRAASDDYITIDYQLIWQIFAHKIHLSFYLYGVRKRVKIALKV